MADEETPADDTETPDVPEAEAEPTPVADATAADEPTPEADAPEEPPAGTDPEAAANSTPEQGATAADPAEAATPDPEEAPVSAPSAETVPDAVPAEILHPKERRRRARQRQTSGAASRTPQERHAERDALREQNAKARAERRRKVRAKKPASTAVAAVVEPAVPGTQKTRQGIVVSDKAAKTITVRIDTSRRHRRYKKIVRSSKTLHAHDEHDEAHEGDLVRLIETRPLSATKRWRLVEILERAR
jgi:small subunit ribosomal protein S17